MDGSDGLNPAPTSYSQPDARADQRRCHLLELGGGYGFTALMVQ